MQVLEHVSRAGEIMGTNITGWIEIREFNDRDDHWDGVIKIDEIVKGWKTWGILFGMSNIYDIESIANNRGIPEHASTEWRNDIDMYGTFDLPSYIYLEEINAFDWKQQITCTHIRGGIKNVELISLTDVLSDDWKLIFKFMNMLGDKYGTNNIRLVVGFY